MATPAKHRERATVYLNSMRRMLKERMEEHARKFPLLVEFAPAVTEEFVQRFLILARMYTDEKIAAIEAQKKAAKSRRVAKT